MKFQVQLTVSDIDSVQFAELMTKLGSIANEFNAVCESSSLTSADESSKSESRLKSIYVAHEDLMNYLLSKEEPIVNRFIYKELLVVIIKYIFDFCNLRSLDNKLVYENVLQILDTKSDYLTIITRTIEEAAIFTLYRAADCCTNNHDVKRTCALIYNKQKSVFKK